MRLSCLGPGPFVCLALLTLGSSVGPSWLREVPKRSVPLVEPDLPLATWPVGFQDVRHPFERGSLALPRVGLDLATEHRKTLACELAVDLGLGSQRVEVVQEVFAVAD